MYITCNILFYCFYIYLDNLLYIIFYFHIISLTVFTGILYLIKFIYLIISLFNYITGIFYLIK